MERIHSEDQRKTLLLVLLFYPKKCSNASVNVSFGKTNSYAVDQYTRLGVFSKKKSYAVVNKIILFPALYMCSGGA
jgi:hypothetical protein